MNFILDRKQSALSTIPTIPTATTLAATTPAATTPAAITLIATTSTTPIIPIMPIVLIESEEVAEVFSRKKQKTVTGAIKNYSDDDSPFIHKYVNYFLNKFEEMNSRQIEMNNSQIKIEREIFDIRKLLTSSGIKSDYTTENEFINKVANSAIDKRIYLDESYLKSVAAGCIELKFHEYFGSWENKRWSSYCTKYIQSPLLVKHRSLRGSITNRVRSAFFAVFREHELPYINTKSAPQEIKKWKDSDKLKNVAGIYQRIDNDKEMTWCARIIHVPKIDFEFLSITRIIQKTWSNFKKLTKEKIAIGMAVCQYMLNPKTESIKINDEEIHKIMKVKKVNSEKGEEEEEEEEEEEKEEEKKREEREEEYEDKVIFTGQSFRLRNNSLA
ncbi:hypothetical protein Glove_551g74 [Diversispora epigaea]|uniref:Uncharacterized protein n=1 Tax=Diversispora epigaea TaxID=1348612 RepID=A0A397GK53_9GLOM|nr:hypothetical protein Glove_551g74 [Diversispora epigaea]